MLEEIPSRLLAMRNQYALSVAIVSQRDLPEHLRQHFNPSFSIELHTLHENGTPVRFRWIMRDSERNIRVVAGNPPNDVNENSFIEIYNDNGLLTEEYTFHDNGSVSISTFFYNIDVIVRSETRLRRVNAEETEELEAGETIITLLHTDFYRYSRSNFLRSVERIYHADAEAEPQLLAFPVGGVRIASAQEFITPVTAHTSSFLQDVVQQDPTPEVRAGNRVLFTTDERGRVITETRYNADGSIQGEIRNIWDGDRLQAVVWMSGGDERRTEYEYNASGDRIFERNLNRGVLERTVRRENNQDIEELYMNGRVVLRAVWENGRRISEERVRD